MKPVRLLVVLLLSLLASACSKPEGKVFHDQFFAFGTLIDLTLYDVDPTTARQASERLEQDFEAMHGTWHAWQPGALTAINDLFANRQTATLDASMLALLTTANRLSQLSNGLFNPVIGQLVALWGFHDNPLPIGTLADKQDLSAQLAQLPSADDINIEGNRISSRNPAARYDLGAFAKGYAIDRAIERLRAMGIENAIINAGGDLRAIGRHGDRPWQIGIRHPRQPDILASVEIEGDTSVFTSGDYERFFEVDGRRYHHIIDPRSGYPADRTSSVTVIHSDAATADAAATALFVAGPDEWQTVASRMGIRLVMLVDTGGIIHMNPAMQSRIRFEPGINAEVRLSEPLP
ncbi:MAG: FAD:protein FMN transferase [Gammaproteobacteria bacterium]